MKVLAILLCALIASCTTVRHPPASSITPSELMSAPDQYDGRTVLVQGWMNSRFENYTLWDSQKSERQGNFMESCVGLLIPRSMDTSRFDKHNVLIEGVFLKRLPASTVFLGGCNGSVVRLEADRSPVTLP